MGVLATGYARCRDALVGHLASPDPLAAAANTGAFVVWSHQPFYPLYVWLLVGRDFWPILLTWLSTPFFAAVAPLSRRHPLASRVLFVGTGVFNTLLATKALGTATQVGWYLVPCAVLVLGYFRLSEWPVLVAMAALITAAGLVLGHLGAPLHAYPPSQVASLTQLNLWSLGILAVYLVYAAVRARQT